MGNRTQPKGQSDEGSGGEVEPVSGRHFVNNEDVFAIFKFLQMFFHPDPNPKEARRRRNKNPSSCIHFCLSAKRRTDRRTDGRAIRRELGNNSWERGQGSGKKGRRMVYFIRILAGNYIFKISCEPGTSLCINVPIITLGLTV